MAEKTELLEEDEKVVEIELERLREFENHAYILRDMRRDYKLFNSQLCILGKDQEYF